MNLRTVTERRSEFDRQQAIEEMTLDELHAALKAVATVEFSKERDQLKPMLEAVVREKQRAQDEQRYAEQIAYNKKNLELGALNKWVLLFTIIGVILALYAMMRRP